MICLTKKVDDDTIIGFYFLGCVGQSNLIHVRIIYHANETLRRVALCVAFPPFTCAPDEIVLQRNEGFPPLSKPGYVSIKLFNILFTSSL